MQQQPNQHAVELWQLRHALFNYLESPNGSAEADQALGVVIELVDGGADPEKPEPPTIAPNSRKRSNQVFQQ